MHDHFFAERRGHDVVAVGEGAEDSLCNLPTQRFKQQAVTDKGDATPDHNSPRREESDDVTDGRSEDRASIFYH
jgi:hypothetical protein